MLCWLMIFLFCWQRVSASPDHTAEASSELVLYKPISVKVPVKNNGETETMPVFVPLNPSSRAIADPATLFRHVQGAWDAIVSGNQAGLVDAKQQNAAALAPLTASEAWHHFKAGQQGIIDSARFLITFSIVPSVQSGGSPLHTAAAHNDVQAIERIASNMVSVDEEKIIDGTTALFTSVALGHEEATQKLLALGANANHVAKTGVTALIVASSFGHLELVRILIEKGNANINFKHKFALTSAMHFAAEMGRADVIRLLCERGADVHAMKRTGGTPLHTAADTNQSSVVGVLLSPVCGSRHTDLMNEDTTALYLASQRGFVSVIRTLIKYGADVDFIMPQGKSTGQLASRENFAEEERSFYRPKNTEIGNGATALHAAVENGHLDAVSVLLESGASQLTSMQGASPLLISLLYQHPQIAMRLLREKPSEAISDAAARVKINSQTPHDGNFALLEASKRGYFNVARRLIQLDADVSMKDRRGQSALILSILGGHTNVAELILRHSKHDALAEAMLTAAGVGNTRLLELILEYQTLRKGGLDVQDKRGVTPLLLAAQRGYSKIVRILLERGADANLARSTTGITPLMAAAQNGYRKIVKLLIKAGAEINAEAKSEFYGATALYLACQQSKHGVIKTLIRSGGNVNAKLERIGVTPIFVAAQLGNTKLVKLLLENGATVHHRNWNGVTAFGLAVLSGKNALSIYDLLLNAGSLIDTIDNEGATPLQGAVTSSDQRETIVYLLDKDADPKHKNHNDTSVVESAILSQTNKNFKIWCVNVLLQAGAEVHLETILIAVSAGATQLLELLIQYAIRTKTISNRDIALLVKKTVMSAPVSVIRRLLNMSMCRSIASQYIDELFKLAQKRNDSEIHKAIDSILMETQDSSSLL